MKLGLHNLLVLMAIIHCNFSEAAIQLNYLSTLYLPYSYRPTPTYIFDRDVSEQSAYDAEKMLLYTVGNELLHVIDVSVPEKAKVIFYTTLKGGELTDIETCGDFVAVAYDNMINPLDGQVVIYSGYDFGSNKMERIHTIKVGALPDMLQFTSDCRKIVVALEGEMRMIDNEPVDPEGGVAIIRFLGDDPSTMVHSTVLNFTKFNFMAEEYMSRGVRWVYHGEGTRKNTTFSQDLEPEYVTINGDETKAYIVLEENNAIAEVDIVNDEIIEIHPLGSKSWKGLLMDTSDKDGGINLRSWPLRGLYQPDALKYVTIGGRGYIITANEGEEKEYEEHEFSFEFTDGKPGKYFVENDLLDDAVPNYMKEALADDSQLGQLRLSTVDGKDHEFGKYKELFSYGGRSFSIWDETDMSLVYDSGDELERRIAEHFPEVFSSDGQAKDGGPQLSKDSRSKKKGPEAETFDLGNVNGKTVLFVASERPGVILIYTFPPGNETNPLFESAHYAGGRGDSWEALFARRETRDVDPEDIKFVPGYNSPNGEPMLIVSGTTSGTVSFYRVVDSEPIVQKEQMNPNGLNGFVAGIAVSTY